MSLQVVGIDPSLRCTGYTVADGSRVIPGRIRTKPVAGVAAQRDQIRFIVGTVLRAAPQVIDLTVIEKPFVSRHGGDVIDRSWLFGLLVDQLMQRGPVALVTARGRAKYAAHNGNADKQAVLAAVRDAYPTVPVRDDNEADSIALAAMGMRFLGSPIDGVGSKKQLEAMTAVVWPDLRGSN